MGTTEDRVNEIEEHVAALTADAAETPTDGDALGTLPGTADADTELRHLRSEVAGLRNETARGFEQLSARLDRLEGRSGGR